MTAKPPNNSFPEGRFHAKHRLKSFYFSGINLWYQLPMAVLSAFAMLLFIPSPSNANEDTHVLLKDTSPTEFDIRPGPGVTRHFWLGEIFSPIRGTAADTPVYILEGEHRDPVVFIIGGTHATEPAGMLAAITLVERAVIERGTLVVIPYANPLSIEADQTTSFVVGGEERHFHHGSRRTFQRFHPELDGDNIETPSGRSVSARETRNLNRVWPGNAEGTPTEQLAYAMTRLMKEEGTKIAFDLHEVRFRFEDLVWTLAADTKYAALLEAVCERVNRKIQLDLIRSRPTDIPPGVSRTEWGPSTGAIAFTTETSRAGATPMETRVGIQLELVAAVLSVIGVYDSSLQSEFVFFPGMDDILANGPLEPDDREGPRL